MTQQEAQQAIHQGNKVTNTYFTSDEYVHLVNGTYTFEDGVKVPDEWWLKDYTKDGWSIFE